MSKIINIDPETSSKIKWAIASSVATFFATNVYFAPLLDVLDMSYKVKTSLMVFMPVLVAAVLATLYITFFRVQIGRKVRRRSGLVSYEAALKESKYMPKDLYGRIYSHLDFLGHGGSKWVASKQKMEDMMTRLSTKENKRVRFLLLDPMCDACLKYSKARDERYEQTKKRILESLVSLQGFSDYDWFEVRLYDHKPSFRMTILDEEVVILGHYHDYQRDSKDTPLLIFESKHSWSFVSAFQSTYSDIWNSAKEADWKMINDEFRKVQNERRSQPEGITTQTRSNLNAGSPTV